MSAICSQAFRAQQSSNIISIPTRHDSTSKQDVVLLTDIQMSFRNVQRIMRDGDTVLFLTDKNLQYLLPPRIAHQPGVILDVIVTDDNQRDPNSMGVAASTGTEAAPAESDVTSLGIRETDNSHALVASAQDRPLEMALQRLPTSITANFQLGTENQTTQQDHLHQLRLQMDAVLGRMQQTEQQAYQIQQQMEEVLGRSQQTDHQMEEALEKIQQTDLKIQGVIGMIHETDRHQEEVLETKRQIDQQAQLIQQLKQQLNKALEKIQEMERQAKSPQLHNEQLQLQSHQETMQLSRYLALVQHRAQVILTESCQNLPIPRLFIILPEPTDVVNGQKRPHLRFRLHFLCECDAHKMTKKNNGLHEVHMVNHPGYDLINQNEFIDKYGPYLLTMMNMAKYGTKAGGLVVLPLLGLKDATEDDKDQEHLQHIKENIGRLVDDTITHLESATKTTNRTNITTQQSLDAQELAHLKSYLKVKNGELFIEGLWFVTTHDGHCAWVCRYHLVEYHNLALQRLKKIVTSSCGVCRDNKGQLKITSEATTRQLYDMISDVCKAENIGNWESLINGSLELGSHSSAVESTSDVTSTLDGTEPLSLDFGRLSMVANRTSRGVIGNVALEVARLSDLTLDDLEFIHHCQPVLLKILHASQEADEARLIDILQHGSKLRQLHVGCDGKRSFKLINSILSAREKTLQSRGLSALHTLEVMGEGLLPHNPNGSCTLCQHNGYDYAYDYAVRASFSEESHHLEIHAKLSWEQLLYDGACLCDFIRHYGWAIKTLNAPDDFNDNHAKLLDEATHERGSIIEHLDLTPFSLSGSGLSALDRVIKRSQKVVSMQLSLKRLDKDDQLKKALPLLGRYKERVKSLYLSGEETGWLKRLAETFPDKDDFPMLEALCGVYGIPWKGDSPGLVAWFKGGSQPVKKFCSASTGKIGDKGLLHQWATSSR